MPGSRLVLTGSFDVAVDERVTEVDGHRAFVHHLERGEGGPEPRVYSYFVELSAPIPCETSEWLEARTESDDADGLELNGPILDAMMASVSFVD